MYIVICDNTPEVICKLMQEEEEVSLSSWGFIVLVYYIVSDFPPLSSVLLIELTTV